MFDTEKFPPFITESKNSNANTIAWLRMWKLWGKITTQLLSFSSLQKTLEYAQKSPKLSQSVISENEAELLFNEAKNFGAEILTPTHPLYPKELLEIHDFPLAIYAHGNLELLQKQKIAIVGSRSASAEAMQIAYNFSKELSQSGFAVVSGFANGIDTSACKGAINFGSIQVLGSGLKNPYPKNNSDLFHEAIKKGSLFLSEFPLSFSAKPSNFPIRNRIITGLSQGVLIGQANRRNGISGTLVTLRIAINQGKEIFACPGSILDERHTICNSLIKNGTAHLTTCSQDIISVLQSSNPKNNNLQTQQKLAQFEKTFEEPALFTKDEPLLPEEETEITKIYSVISTIPITIDDIAAITRLPTAQLQQILIELELEGKVTIDALGKYTRSLL